MTKVKILLIKKQGYSKVSKLYNLIYFYDNSKHFWRAYFVSDCVQSVKILNHFILMIILADMLSSLFYRSGNGGAERLSNLPRVWSLKY